VGDVSEKLIMALGEALVRKGVLDPDDLIEAAERTDDADVAHLLSCMILQAEAPDVSDWQADQRRKQIRLVSDGGNPD
jgi:hypothetical protein